MVGVVRMILKLEAAGCHTALIGTEDFGQEMTVNGLLELAEKL